MEERREFGRRNSTLDGFVKLPLRPPVPCRLLNVSSKGALLEVDHIDFVPQKFKVSIGNYETEVELKHRTRGQIGVQFQSPYRFEV